MDSWLKAGSKDITAVAREKTMKILKEHEPVPMDRGVIAEIEKYIKKESKTYGHRDESAYLLLSFGLKISSSA